MKFTVVAVGKLKERFWVDACAEYLKRLQPYAKTQVREIADVDPRKVGGVEGPRYILLFNAVVTAIGIVFAIILNLRFEKDAQ